jgi:hypothetical protein
LILVDFLMDGQDNWLGIEEGLELDEGFDLGDEGFGLGFCSTEGIELDEALGSKIGGMNDYEEGFDILCCDWVIGGETDIVG